MLAPRRNDVKNIKAIGNKTTKIKKVLFSSNFIFLKVNVLITNNSKAKSGIKIPICLPKNFKG